MNVFQKIDEFVKLAEKEALNINNCVNDIAKKKELQLAKQRLMQLEEIKKIAESPSPTDEDISAFLKGTITKKELNKNKENKIKALTKALDKIDENLNDEKLDNFFKILNSNEKQFIS